MFKKTLNSIRFKEYLPLVIILIVAAIVRFIGLDYGLPLWLVGDEVSHIFGTLKMLELKTLLPALHVKEFVGVFHYTPYLSYLYIAPFLVLAGLKFILFSGSFTEFKNYLAADPSIFFIAARAVSAFFGLATVWVVYLAAYQLFLQKRAALFASMFLALSFLHVSYSHWARHWIAVTFFFAVGAYVLAHRQLTVSKRYTLLALIIGFGVGINVQVLLLGIYVIIWFFLFDREPLLHLIKRLWFWKAVAIFLILFVAGFILWPSGYGYLLSVKNLNSSSVESSRSLAGFGEIYWFYLINLIKTEPLFLFFTSIGIVSLFFSHRRLALAVGIFSFLYIAAFYFMFEHVDRFILVLYPFGAISAGYGLAWVLGFISSLSAKNLIITAVVVLMLIPIVRYDYLLLKNDTRTQAISWAKSNLPAGVRVIVLAPLTRLSSSSNAATELEAIDSNSLRVADRIEMQNTNNSTTSTKFHALNLFTVVSPVFFSTLDKYMVKNNYQYIIVDTSFAKIKGFTSLNSSIGVLQKSFSGSGDPLLNGHQRMPDGFGEGLKELFFSPSLGPGISIIKL